MGQDSVPCPLPLCRLTTDAKSIAAPLKLSTFALSTKEYTVDCGTTYNFVKSVGGGEMDLAISVSTGTLPLRFVLDGAFMRKCYVKFVVGERRLGRAPAIGKVMWPV